MKKLSLRISEKVCHPLRNGISPLCERVCRPFAKWNFALVWKGVSPFCETVFRPCVKRCVTLLRNGISPLCERVCRPIAKRNFALVWKGVSPFAKRYFALVWKGVSLFCETVYRPCVKRCVTLCETLFRPCVKRCVTLLRNGISPLCEKECHHLRNAISPLCEKVCHPFLNWYFTLVWKGVTLLWDDVSYFSRIFVDFKAQLVLHGPQILTRNIPHFVHTIYVCMYVWCLPILTTNSNCCCHIHLSLISVKYEMGHYK
jgi:hypothetical protein